MRPEDTQTPATLTPPSTLEIEALAEAHLAIDRRLVAGIRQLRDAETGLQQALASALDALQPPPTPAGWLRTLARMGLLVLDTPPPLTEEALWQRHEHALEAVRSLGHHLETLERELALLQDSIAGLEARHRALALARGQAAAQATVHESRQEDAWPAHRAVERLATAEERIAGLLASHREVRSTLRELVGGLAPLYQQGGRALDTLSRQITTLAAQAAASQRSAISASLRESLGELILAAELQVSHTGQQMDALGTRLGRLDEDAARRAAARVEVERTLLLRKGREAG